ncbi:hypothetical protein Dsin_032216 [Dipteronia sinensis]|uniref:HMA domain-containing protein n=1 Tax=Dipteronia sinensis TaxID=43782 RepID=A0AAD9ZN10_9ROSI|nr:hypothetical protein Dsin_032216 [Dipteronia sinensis]
MGDLNANAKDLDDNIRKDMISVPSTKTNLFFARKTLMITSERTRLRRDQNCSWIILMIVSQCRFGFLRVLNFGPDSEQGRQLRRPETDSLVSNEEDLSLVSSVFLLLSLTASQILAKKKIIMKGFMCHSTAATAVCMATVDSRSVFVPRRPHTTLINIDDHTRLVANANYSRLVNKSHSNRFVSPTNNSSIKRDLPRPKPPNKLSTTVASSDQVFQVVVMRVSLHCHGCAGKVKKHLTKMEGVTSFSIDLETKRVTVMGHVSPTEVLESISRVKKAEFWTC